MRTSLRFTSNASVPAEESLRALAPRTRLVYVLHDVHHLTLGEVAQALGISADEAARCLAEAHRMAGDKSVKEA